MYVYVYIDIDIDNQSENDFGSAFKTRLVIGSGKDDSPICQGSQSIGEFTMNQQL